MLIRFVLFLILIFLIDHKVAYGAAHWRFKGLIEGSESLIKKKYPRRIGGRPTQEAVDLFIGLLDREDKYERISAFRLRNRDILIFAEEQKKISRVVFIGNSRFDHKTLEQSLGIKKGDRFDSKKIKMSGKKLSEFYQSKGYLNTGIRLKTKKVSQSELQLEVILTEKQASQLTKVTIDTDNKFLKGKIKNQLAPFLGKAFLGDTKRVILEKLNSYLIKYRYYTTDLKVKALDHSKDRSSVELKISMSKTYRFDFFFKGNEKMSVPHLMLAIKLSEFERSSLDPSIKILQRIRQKYLSRGYAHIKVEIKKKVDEENFSKRVYFYIDEGPRVKIAPIEIIGRLSKPVKYYADFIRQHSSPLVEVGYYNKKDLQQGYENLKNDLINNGYLTADILSVREEYSKNKKQVFIQVMLDEGPLTQVRKISFIGGRSFERSQLLAVLTLKTYDPFRKDEIEKSLKNISQFYRTRGYLEMKIRNLGTDLTNFNTTGTRVDLKIDIYEGPQIVVKAISLRGNSFTKDYVIEREIDIKVGAVLTPDAIEESRARLEKLGIFGRVEIRTLEEGTTVAQRTVLVSVEERNPGLLKTGIGVNNELELTLRGFVGLSYNNIEGTARAASGRAELKQNIGKIDFLEHKINFGYVEPFLFDSRYKGRVNLTRSVGVKLFDSSDNIATINELNKVEFLIERDVTSDLKLLWNFWTIDSTREYFDIKDLTKVPADKLEDLVSSKTNIVTVGPTVIWDKRDNPFLPTRGSFSRWSLDYSDPLIGSTDLINFYRTETGYTHYLSFGDSRIVWANSLRGGYLQNLSGRNGGVPGNYIFRLGGLSTVRGYGGSNGAESIPTDEELGITVGSSNQLVINTSSTYYLIKSEVRFPIVGNFGGVVFYDGGEVSVVGKTFKNPYRQSVGVGFRFNTPLGPISLDYAQKINPQEGARTDRIHFSIGTF